MLVKLKFGFVFCISLLLIGFSSCSGDNMDITSIEDDTVDPEVVEEVVNCSGDLNLKTSDNATLDFSEEAEGTLFRASCPDFGQFPPALDYNYLIVDADFDSFGSGNDEGYYDISDGIPAISFGSAGLPVVGDVLSPYGDFESLFRTPDGTAVYSLNDLKITIVEIGDEVGDVVSGTLSGLIYDNNFSQFDVEGSFCIELGRVCE